MTPADTERQRLDALADALADGRITVAEWLTAMRAELQQFGAGDAAQQDVQAYAAQLEQQPVIDAAAVKAHVEAYLAPPQPDNALPDALAVVGSLAFFAAAAQKVRLLEQAAHLSVPTIDSPVFARYADYYRTRVDALAQALSEGRISAAEWGQAMGVEVQQAHVTAYVLGRGGVEALDRQDFATLNTLVNRQLGYLEAWTQQISAGTLPSAEYVQNRARLYLNAANASLQRGATEAFGMPELPAYAGDGSSICRANDKCQWDIQTLPGAGNWDVFWRLYPAEHCKTCLARADLWNPLTIRDGIIQPYPDDPDLFAD